MGYIGSDPKTKESVSTSQLINDSVTNEKIVDDILFTSVTSSIVSASHITASSYQGGFDTGTSTRISGSLGANATTIRNLTSAGITGSFSPSSASFSTRTTTLEVASGSLSTRVTTNESDLTTLKGSGTVQGVSTGNTPTFAGVTVTGTLTAQEVHTEFESASILFSSGSTKFGDTIDDTHEVTGSMTMSGSLTVNNGALTVENITIDSSDINNATGNFTFSHNGTEKLTITSDKVMFSADAKVDANNSRDLGTSGARFKDLYLAGNANVSKTGSFGKILVDGNKSSMTAPGLAFDNDTDTGLVWGGNNALAITTGGARKVEFKADYEVSIEGGGSNTSTAANAYADNLVIRGSNDGDGSGITIFSETDEFGTLYFGDGASGNAAYRGYVQYNHADDTLQIGAAGALRMKLDSSSRLFLSNGAGSYNTLLGQSAGDSVGGSAEYNTLVGHGAGSSISSALQNTLVGYQTGDALVGAGSGQGSYNVAMGVNTLGAMTTGQQNVALGNGALGSSTSGNFNVAIGQDCLTGGEGTPQYNVAIGQDALNSTGGAAVSEVVAIGREAGTAINHADSNGTVAVGAFALGMLTSGQANTAVGFAALYNGMDVGDFNTAVGYQSLYALNPGSDGHGSNTAVGYKAGHSVTTAENNTFMGARAGEAVTGAGNVIIGREAGLAMTSGANCVIIGHGAAAANNTRSNLVIIGVSAGAALTSGDNNVFVGYQTGQSVSTGDHNTLIGHQAGQSLAGSSSHNTFIGMQAGDSCNASGDGNNTAVGSEAGTNITSGTGNVVIGASAGRDSVSGNGLDTGANNVLLGVFTRPSSANGNSEFVVGNDIEGQGNSKFTYGYGSSYVGLTAGSTTVFSSSDKRIKKNIKISEAGLSFINDLKPVTFEFKEKGELETDFVHYKKDSTDLVKGKKGKTYHGFIAQEVKEAIDKHDGVQNGFDGWYENEVNGEQQVGESAFIPMLVKAVQELSSEIENIKKTCKCMNE